MKAVILNWTNADNGNEVLDEWLSDNPGVKIISSSSFGYGFINQYGSAERNNYTQIFYDDTAIDTMNKLDNLLHD